MKTTTASREGAATDGVADWFPWARHNLVRNPFGELTRAERVAVAVVDIAGISQRVRQPYSAVQLIGDCGRGKTTRMLSLADQLPESQYVYLPEDGPCPAIAAGSPLLIDEAQRLPKCVFPLVFSAGIPLVLGTHRDLSRHLKRFGYQVHTEHIGDENSATLLHRLLNRRIEAARLDAGRIPVVSPEDADWLVNRFGSDVRGVESYLYEKTQTQVVEHGQMRFVD
ncbi:MAG: hypothetical protein AB8B91_14620 [Rubripirellula sp.]